MTPIVSPGATDCHIHLFGPPDVFPYSEDRAYTPPNAVENDARRMMAELGLARVVLVHASAYGDNQRLLHGLADLGDSARGVAVLTGDEDHRDLQALDAQGVRGVRLNNISRAALSPEQVAETALEMATKVADLGWHVQVYLQGNDLKAVLDRLDDMPAPVVIDHFGSLSPDLPDRAALTDLLAGKLADGRCWVKLSASYRLADNGAEIARDLTQRFVAANPECLLWASDWPHSPVDRNPKLAKREQPFRVVDTKGLLTDFLETVADPETRRRILVDNAAELYGFGKRRYDKVTVGPQVGTVEP